MHPWNASVASPHHAVPSAGYTQGAPHHNGQLDKHTFVHIYRQSAVLRLVPLSRQLPHGYGSSPPGLHHATFRACGVSSCFELLFYTSATRRRPLVERQPVEELFRYLVRAAPDSSRSIFSFFSIVRVQIISAANIDPRTRKSVTFRPLDRGIDFNATRTIRFND